MVQVCVLPMRVLVPGNQFRVFKKLGKKEMKKIFLLVLVASLITAGCYAKCINNSPNCTHVMSNIPAGYQCSVKKTDPKSLFTKSVNPDGSASYACNGCGCDLGYHDAGN